jgi:hypothetical protein
MHAIQHKGWIGNNKKEVCYLDSMVAKAVTVARRLKWKSKQRVVHVRKTRQNVNFCTNFFARTRTSLELSFVYSVASNPDNWL